MAQALLLVETLDGEQFERLFNGEADPESIKAEVDSEIKEIERKNKKEAEESARILEEERLEKMNQLDNLQNGVKPDIELKVDDSKGDKK